VTALANLEALPFQVHRFDPEKHGAFVYSTFREQTNRRNGRLRRHLMTIGSKVLVATAPDDADALIGWCATLPGNLLVFAYVKYVYRRDGIGSSLAIAAGCDFAKPVRLVFWTRAASRIAAKEGNPYRLVPWAARKEP